MSEKDIVSEHDGLSNVERAEKELDDLLARWSEWPVDDQLSEVELVGVLEKAKSRVQACFMEQELAERRNETGTDDDEEG